MTRKKYIAALKDPRWQKKRLRIMERDGFKCQFCGNSRDTLNVHHLRYSGGKMPWEYTDKFLATLCEICHEKVEDERAEIALSLCDPTAFACHHHLRKFLEKNGRELGCIFSSLIASIGCAYERGDKEHVEDIQARCHGIDEKWKHPALEESNRYELPIPLDVVKKHFAAMREAAK